MNKTIAVKIVVGISSIYFLCSNAYGEQLEESESTDPTNLVTKTSLSPNQRERPYVIKTVPANGDNNVNPQITTNITVTYNKPMGGGMSWCKACEGAYPDVTGANTRSADKCTWIKPVKLEANKTYALRMNCLECRNFFKDTDGRPAMPYLLVFRTGATSTNKEDRPYVIKTVPANGDNNVSAQKTTNIVVTYNKPMGGGMSWCKAGRKGEYPDVTGANTRSADKCSWIKPVKLEANNTYAIWMNTEHHTNFKDTDGRPAIPYLLVFRTIE